jgi:hypothetical protein
VSYNAAGGMFQYNDLPHTVLGIKGSLDNDRFIEVFDNGFPRSLREKPYPRRSGKYLSDINYGIKPYGDLFFKPLDNLTWGFWNHMVLGEDKDVSPTRLDRLSEPRRMPEGEAPSLYLQTTPRLIYEWRGGPHRIVGELYADNRVYFGDSLLVEGREYN